jgi:hypothetical protein
MDEIERGSMVGDISDRIGGEITCLNRRYRGSGVECRFLYHHVLFVIVHPLSFYFEDNYSFNLPQKNLSILHL